MNRTKSDPEIVITLTGPDGAVVEVIEIPRRPPMPWGERMCKPSLLAHRYQERRVLASWRPLVTTASSQFLTLEAPKVVVSGRVISRADHIPALSAHLIRDFGGLVVRQRDALELPLRQRGLLRARGRDNKPSRSAPNGAASSENQGNPKTSSRHAARVAHSRLGAKAWS
jgi:hypothetical protein